MTSTVAQGPSEDGSAPGRSVAALRALLLGLTAGSAVLLIGQAVEPRPVRIAGLTLDRLSAALSLLVATVGTVTFRFSERYLDGEPGRRRFLHGLAMTVVAAYGLMLASHLLLLLFAWSLTSLGLHRLLTHYPDRPEARRPARKKFLISRLGDLSLLAALAVIGQGWGTLDLRTFLEAATSGPRGPGVTAVALLVAVAALTKSAQFPFHSWLPETMEAPTPVSALMHAGLLNAGGALLLRFAPLIVQVPEAMLLLVTVGTLTAGMGMVALWAQVKIKRALAWSTVSQMGFMMVQCGLGAFPAALLHLLGHGLYKAWSFLKSGEVPGPSAAVVPPRPDRALALALLGAAASLPAMTVAAWATGFSPLHAPGELALAGIVALAVGQFWVAFLGAPVPGSSPARAGLAAVLATMGLVTLAFALYRGTALFLMPVWGPLPAPTGPLAWLAAILPVATFLVLTLLHAALPALACTPQGRALYVHALHGFYFGAIADRWVDAVCGRLLPAPKEASRA